MVARIWRCGRGLGRYGVGAAPIRVVRCVTTGASSRIHSLVFFVFFIHEGSKAWLIAMESALPAAGFLYWVGAGTVAYLALRISYSLFTAFQVWGLGHGPGVGPELGEWAGESDPAPPASSLLQRLAPPGPRPGCRRPVPGPARGLPSPTLLSSFPKLLRPGPPP